MLTAWNKAACGSHHNCGLIFRPIVIASMNCAADRPQQQQQQQQQQLT
jgi:hypothetical protein